MLHSRRLITEPDGFGDAVSGIDLLVEFQRRQEKPSSVEQFQTPGWALDFGQANARTRVRGAMSGGWASLCVIRGPGDSTWNGQRAAPGSIACLPPGVELDGHTASGFSWTTMAIPPQVWAQCQALAGRGDGHSRCLHVHPLAAPLLGEIEHRLGVIQRLLHDCLAQPQLAPAALRQAAGLATHTFTTVCELAVDQGPPRDSLRNRARLARRAGAWMRDHFTESVQVPDVCLALGVSRRELEYAFRTVFDEGPREHLQTLRLHAIRRALRRTHEPIIRVAFDHGISHLGRFAAQYQALFGELPSETRAAAAP